MTVGCARCHDHKDDPIPTEDYYRLQAFFNAIKIEDVNVPFKDKAFAGLAAARKRLESGPERKALDELESGLLRKLREKKLEEAKEHGWTVQDVRLELRRKNQTLRAADRFSRPGAALVHRAADRQRAGVLTAAEVRYAAS